MASSLHLPHLTFPIFRFLSISTLTVFSPQRGQTNMRGRVLIGRFTTLRVRLLPTKAPPFFQILVGWFMGILQSRLKVRYPNFKIIPTLLLCSVVCIFFSIFFTFSKEILSCSEISSRGIQNSKPYRIRSSLS